MTGKSQSAQLKKLVNETLESLDFELVQVEYLKTGGDWTLRVFIDHPEGVTLDMCQKATRALLDELEENDPVAQDYHIEVSSPGVDRPLVKPADFQRFHGERVYVKLHRAIDGQKVLTGELDQGDGETFVVCHEQDGKNYPFTFEDIAKATLKPVLNFC